MLYSFLRMGFWVFTHLICRYRIIGRENIPATGPILIVSNHLSWYDPVLLGVILPRRVWIFTKAEIFRWPIVGAACRATGQIPVHRGTSDRAALDMALGYLREGKAVMVFPEGTVARKEQMIAAHAGAAMLAIRSGATVLPISLTGTRRILRTLRSAWFPRVSIQIGAPFVPSIPEGAGRKAELKVVTQEIMQRIAGMIPIEQRGVYKVE
jgi:1-acyl-sn-glycerol-3-phosphate acyltransferase